MNIKRNSSNDLTITPYGVAHQLVTVYGDTVDGTWNAETALQYVAHSTLDWMQPNILSCIKALNYLNQKLEAVRKTVSFWDAYQITDVVDDKNTVLSKITQLPNNSSLITNVSNPFSWMNPLTGTNESIYSGDIFIKDYTGVVHLIHATNKGIYVPTSINFASGNSVTIGYTYQTTGKKDVEITPTGAQSFQPDEDSGYNYHGIIEAGDTITFPALDTTAYTPDLHPTCPIIPIVKFFLNGHQVFLKTTVLGPTGDPAYFSITNPTPLDLIYEVR